MRFQLRRERDNALVGEWHDLNEAMTAIYQGINVPLIEESNLWRDRIIIATGRELNELFTAQLARELAIGEAVRRAERETVSNGS